MRYSRLVSVDGIGREGVERLRNASVMVVGCGALGSMCSMYLAASGIGRLGIADFDTIDISNLQRQLFFKESEVGMSKAEILSRRIKELNREVELEVYNCLITADKAKEIFNKYDFIIDATDNPSSKFMVDEVCRKLGKPYCIGGVSGFVGQVMSWHIGSTPYSAIFTRPQEGGCILDCSRPGVVGPAAGTIASIQSSEAIKHITKAGDMLYDKIFTIDLRTMKAKTIDI